MKSKTILGLLIIIYIVSCTALSSCYNSRKAGTQVTKAIVTYPAQTATQLRDRWPCVIGTVKPGDSVSYKQYMEDLKTIEEFYQAQDPATHDTFVETWVDSVKVKYLLSQNKILHGQLVQRDSKIADLLKRCRDAPVIHDTIEIKDMAEVFVLQDQGRAKDSIINKRDQSINDLTNKADKRGKWNWYLAAAVVALAFLNFLQLKRR